MPSEFWRSAGQQSPDAGDSFPRLQAMAAAWVEMEKIYGLDIVEKANRAEMVDEAAKRMEMLGLPENAIEEFRNSGRLSFGMENGQRFSLNDAERGQIQRLESNEEYLVYAVIRNNSSYGRMVNYIMVSRHKCDWGLERATIKEKAIVTAYVYNYDVPLFSEAGTITIKRLPGGMLDREMEQYAVVSTISCPASRAQNNTSTATTQLRPSHRGLRGIKKDNYPLPEELREFNFFYPYDEGHVVMAIPESLLPRAISSGNLDDYECPIPCRYILAKGYRFYEGYVVCDVPYDRNLGVDVEEHWYDY